MHAFIFQLATLAQAAAPAAEPPPTGWQAGADFVVKQTVAHPDQMWPLLAIVGPVVVGFAFIGAAVKWGLPFVRDELANFRKHVAELLTATRADAAGDAEAARKLSASQQDAIVQRVEGKLDRHTGELQKLSERTEKHGELLRSVAQKIGVGLLVVLAVAGAVLAGRSHSARMIAAGECASSPCPSEFHCCGSNTCCADTKPASKLSPQSALFADSRVDAVHGF